ncbi:NUDIX hydrolase [Propionicimonas sp.]|uniref:NUDIX hydrolase n=1 Tax=Propionicimonas sp. TaxID=1955623 RepID=UPI0039E306C8
MIRESLPFVVTDGNAIIDFGGDDAPQRLHLLVLNTCRLALADPAVRRLETSVAVDDRPRRRALHRAGFRLEGVSRGRWITPDGRVDQAWYALLRGEQTEGREAFTAVMNTVTARKRVISHLLLTDSAGRVCVLETTFKPDFELPGGILEVGESPRVGLVREIEEELSHAVSIGRLLVVDWLAPYLGWEDAVELIFDGRDLADHAVGLLRPDLREIRAVHWLDVEEAVATMAPFARGRLRAALAAREEGRTLYLEAGERIS